MSPIVLKILVYGLVLVGGGLFVWGWLGDWLAGKRGKRALRRCPKCWYDLTHTAGVVCSECGYEGKSEKRFGKSRRRKRWCGLALGMMGGSYSVAVYPVVSARGWAAAVPSWVVIWYLPQIENEPLGPIGDEKFWSYREVVAEQNSRGPDGWGSGLGAGVRSAQLHPWSRWGSPDPSRNWFRAGMTDELAYLVMNDELSQWEWDVLTRRAFAGDAARPPVGAEWGRLYGNLLYRALELGMVDQERVAEFAQALWKIEVRAPERWPADLRYPVHIYRESWSPFRQGGARQVASGNQSPGGGSLRNQYGVIGSMYPTARPSLKLCGPINSTEPIEWFGWESTYSGGDADSVEVKGKWEVSVPRPTAALIDEILTPVEAPEIATLLAAEVTATLGMGGRSGVQRHSQFPVVFVDFSGLEESFLAEALPTIGVVIEILQDDQVQFSGRGWAWTQDISPLQPITARVLTSLAIQVEIPSGAGTRRGSINIADLPYDFTTGVWTVRLTADPQTALFNIACHEYWSGTVTIPLDVGQ